jgi:hypothetical protein
VLTHAAAAAATTQSLASIIWSLSELRLQPPPAWLYHWASAARGVLDCMNPVDLGQVAAALQGSTFRPLQLPKLEALLGDVLARLAALEVTSGAYSRAAVRMLLKMQSSGGGSGSGSSSGSGGSSSRFRRIHAGRSSSSSRQLEAVAVLSAPRGVAAAQHEQDSNGSTGAAGPLEEVARLKEILIQQSVVEGSSSLDDVPELHMGPWSPPSEAPAV